MRNVTFEVEQHEDGYAVREYHDGEPTSILVEIRPTPREANLMCLWHNTNARFGRGGQVFADVAFAKRAVEIGYKGNITVPFVKDGALDFEAIAQAVLAMI